MAGGGCKHLLLLDKGVKGLSEAVDDEAHLAQLAVVEDVAAVEQEGGLNHRVVDLLPVQGLELVPLGHDGDGMGTVSGSVGILHHRQLLLVGAILGSEVGVVPLELGGGEILGDLLLGDLGVVDAALGAIIHEALADIDGGGLAGVTGVLLEGKSEDCELLAGDGVEHGRDHALDEAVLLVVVHDDYLVPVLRDLIEALGLADVHEVEDVLLEAGAAEAHRGVEELGSDAGVGADGVGDLAHVGSGLLAQGRDGVDGRDALGKEGVGHELGELRGPEVGGEDALLRDPVGVHGLEGSDGLTARLEVIAAANQDAVRGVQVRDGSALGKELGVGEDVEAHVGVSAVPVQDLLDSVSSLDRDGRLLNNNLVGGGHRSDHAGSALPVGQIGSEAGADTAGLGRCVHAEEQKSGHVSF